MSFAAMKLCVASQRMRILGVLSTIRDLRSFLFRNRESRSRAPDSLLLPRNKRSNLLSGKNVLSRHLKKVTLGQTLRES